MHRAAAFFLPPLIASTLAAASMLARAQQKSLTVDEIFAHGPLIGAPPEQVEWSPTGKHLTYLDSG
ncbi:MAG TPA: hypothetical protein VN579_06150, partial [Bryobacteraceae bacterium]|nr:hypothetical protein [Bryobacteraceae bacterium]